MLNPKQNNTQLTSAELTFIQNNLRNVYNVRDFGAKVDGSTDDTIAVNNTIVAAQAAGGGVIFFPSGTCTISSAINIPFTGASNAPVQQPLRFTGVGASWNGYWASSPINGGTVLDLRYAGGDGTHVAKIDTRGAGLLEIDHLTIKSGGSDNFQIIQTTNTTVMIHDIAVVGNSANSGTACTQDFLLCGGNGGTIGNASTAPFQGYGSKLSNNYYSNIQRGVRFGNFCNGIEIENETYSLTCGSSLTFGAPYYFDPGATGEAQGIRIRGGTYEMQNYPYLVAMIENTGSCLFDGMGAYVDNVYTVAWFYMDATSTGHIIIVGHMASIVPLLAGSGSSFTSVIDYRTGKLTKFPEGFDPLSISGKVIIANGGTNASSQTIHGVAYYDGSSIVTNSNFAFSGTDLQITNGDIKQSGNNVISNIDHALYLQTATSNPIIFRINSVEKARLDTSGNFGVGQPSPTALVDISGSTTTASSLRIRSGTAPTSPNDGDIWYDGTNLKIRIGAATKIFTIT